MIKIRLLIFISKIKEVQLTAENLVYKFSENTVFLNNL